MTDAPNAAERAEPVMSAESMNRMLALGREEPPFSREGLAHRLNKDQCSPVAYRAVMAHDEALRAEVRTLRAEVERLNEDLSMTTAERLVGVVMGSKDADDYAAQLEAEVRTLRVEVGRLKEWVIIEHDNYQDWRSTVEQAESDLASERGTVARYEMVVGAARVLNADWPMCESGKHCQLREALHALDTTNEGAET